MDGRGDGAHNGRNRPHFHLEFFPRGNRPPADQLNAELIAWMEFLLNNGIEEVGFAVLLEPVLEPGNNVNNVNNGNNVNNENNGNNGNNVNNENNGNNVNNENNGNNVNNENDGNNVNNENNGNHDNVDNLDHNDDIHNGNIDDNADFDNIDNPNVDNVDNNNESAEDAGAGDEVAIRINQGIEENNTLSGRSRRRSREEDDQDVEERNSKRFRWWDIDCTSDSDSDSINSNDFNKNTGNSPVKHAGAEVAGEDNLPGPSRKRSRKHDKVEDERSSKKSGQYYEFGNSTSDTVTVRTGHDLAHSSIDLAEGAGAVEEIEEEVNQQADDKCPQPGGSKKRSRESDEEEDRRGLPGPSTKRSSKHDKVEDMRSSKKSGQYYKFGNSNSDTVTVRTGHDLAHSSSKIDLAEGAGAVDETEDEVNQQVDDKDPQPGGSQKRSRESDEEEDRRGLPGPSRKRSRKHDKVEDERSSKKSGQHYEFADSNSDTVTVRTGHDLAHSSSNIDLAEGAGAVEETEEVVNQQMDDKDPQPGGSQKRSRESDEEEDK
ncbi:homeobox protein 2-like [Siniperca chuatsi]|uniref:homeobox protein 2-like n=1 Tax=Siniperca chuatsi TaxID=119488 RepID=UPI001CE04D32|nr:homeobox protein 2-like [Siniperca chuatsi]XP_044035520.1 homeobox protein 2-like [Siniperca chuatsi]